ncbi:hypothetical protein B0H11DRAFT_2231504 [Mycena galericulata]|nr:hypothetical protein B0H11DRAFT_2231504 [Mycena galericulata]
MSLTRPSRNIRARVPSTDSEKTLVEIENHNGAGVTHGSIPTLTRPARRSKANLYKQKRGPSRSLLRRAGRVIQRVSTSAGAYIPSVRLPQRRSPTPTYVSELRIIIQDVLERKAREEEEERRLWKLLNSNGRVVGGADKFARVNLKGRRGEVQVRGEGMGRNRMDAELGWMRTVSWGRGKAQKI